MKYFLVTLLVGLGLSTLSMAKEDKSAVAYITHEVVKDDAGKIVSVKQVKSQLIIPENSKTPVEEHYGNVAKAETLIDWDTVLSIGKKAVDAGVSVAKAVVKTKGDINKAGGGSGAKESKN